MELDQEKNPNHSCERKVKVIIYTDDYVRQIQSDLILCALGRYIKPINDFPMIKILQAPKSTFLYQQLPNLLFGLLAFLIALITVTVKQVETFTGYILYSFNQTIIEWLNNKFSFSPSSIVTDWQSSLRDRHLATSTRYSHPRCLVNLYFLVKIISLLRIILKIELTKKDTEYRLYLYN